MEIRFKIPPAVLGQTRHGTTRGAMQAHAVKVAAERKMAREASEAAMREYGWETALGDVVLDISVVMKDRRRDFCNLMLVMKPLIDGMQDAGVMRNDKQIVEVNMVLDGYSKRYHGISVQVSKAD